LVINVQRTNRIYDQILGAVITLIVIGVFTYGHHVIKELSKGKLRVDYPLFIYKCEYIEEYKSKKTGLFGLFKTHPQWLYQLSFANLSRTTIKNVDVSINFGLMCEGIHVQPFGCQFFAEPKKSIPDKSFKLVGTNTERIHLLGKEIVSGRSAGCFILVSSKYRPSLSDFVITLRCPNGTFEQINAKEWENIGWQSTTK